MMTTNIHFSSTHASVNEPIRVVCSGGSILKMQPSSVMMDGRKQRVCSYFHVLVTAFICVAFIKIKQCGVFSGEQFTVA